MSKSGFIIAVCIPFFVGCAATDVAVAPPSPAKPRVDVFQVVLNNSVKIDEDNVSVDFNQASLISDQLSSLTAECFGVVPSKNQEACSNYLRLKMLVMAWSGAAVSELDEPDNFDLESSYLMGCGQGAYGHISFNYGNPVKLKFGFLEDWVRDTEPYRSIKAFSKSKPDRASYYFINMLNSDFLNYVSIQKSSEKPQPEKIMQTIACLMISELSFIPSGAHVEFAKAWKAYVKSLRLANGREFDKFVDEFYTPYAKSSTSISEKVKDKDMRLAQEIMLNKHAIVYLEKSKFSGANLLIQSLNKKNRVKSQMVFAGG